VRSVPDIFFAAKEHRGGIMPKIKTNRSAAKRFTVTGSGKIRRRKANLRHILTKKNSKRKRRLGDPATLDSANVKSVRRSLPNSL
jgi:large subunit ribosomal protein L35